MACHSGNNIIRDGLVLHINPVDKNSYIGIGTNVNDLSGNNNDVILLNGVGYNSGSFIFDGVNDYASLGDFQLSSHTMEVWANSSNGSQGGASADTLVNILGNYSTNTGEAGKYTHIGLRGTNLIALSIDDGVLSFVLIGTPVTYTTNEWYHLVLTYDSNGSTKAYVNGMEVGSINFTSNVVFNSAPTLLAKNGHNNKYFNGKIGDVLVYNRALTADEILQNYNNTKSRYIS